MMSQAFLDRGSELKKWGIGLVGGAILTAVTGCSAGLAPAPLIAPAPTAAAPGPATTGGVDIRTPRAAMLEFFRYTGQPSEAALPVATSRMPEFFRYTAMPDATPRLAQPIEVFRYSPTPRGTAQGPGHPLEFFRPTGTPPIPAPPAS